MRAARADATPNPNKTRAAIENGKKGAAAVAARMAALPKWHCAQCGIAKNGTVHQLRKTYCSNECMSTGYKTRMVGAGNPHFRDAARKVCVTCGVTFRSYQRSRKFCTRRCYAESNESMRFNLKRDANHVEIFAELRKRCSAHDLSSAGMGVPDGIAWIANAWHLFDVKNPKTSYGKKGLSKTQTNWATTWKGGPVYLIYTVDEAQRFSSGDFEGIKRVGGFEADPC
jgi:hypothetical protein